MVDVYIFWVLGGFFSGAGVGAYGPKSFDKFYDRKYDGGGVGCFLQYWPNNYFSDPVYTMRWVLCGNNYH